MNTAEEMVARGFRFLRRLGSRNILFSGISGSVSYSPEENDDIDIFIITQCNRLWSTLLRAFIVRILNRDQKICISLTMDGKFASRLFSGEGDYLMASDSTHAIPFVGSEYYSSLLTKSPFVKRYFPEYCTNLFEPGIPESTVRFSFQECLSFLLLASFLAVKGLINNHRFRKAGREADMFRTALSAHFFYFDSVKYQHLRSLAADPYLEEA